MQDFRENKQQEILNFLYFLNFYWVFKKGEYKRRSGAEINILLSCWPGWGWGIEHMLTIQREVMLATESRELFLSPSRRLRCQGACFGKPKFTPTINHPNLQWYSPNLPTHSFSASEWPHGPGSSLCLDSSSLYCHGRPLPTSHTRMESSTTFIYILDSLEDENERKALVQTSGCQYHKITQRLPTGCRKLLCVLPSYCQLFSIVHF